jgi:hypothetical protein
MIGLIPYILILLGISAVAMLFIFRVISRQTDLFKRPIAEKDIRQFRITLFAIALVIVIMGLIPITINLITLIVELGDSGDSGRPNTISSLSLVYSLGVHLQTLFLSYLLWRIYRLANDDES